MSASVPRRMRTGRSRSAAISACCVRSRSRDRGRPRSVAAARVIGDRDRLHAELGGGARHLLDRVLAVAVGRVAVERGRHVGERDEIGEVIAGVGGGELVGAVAHLGRQQRQAERAVDVGLVGRVERREVDAALAARAAQQLDVLGRAGRARSAPSRSCCGVARWSSQRMPSASRAAIDLRARDRSSVTSP